MEDVLDIYKTPYNPDIPVVCMDETCRQLIGESRTPLPVKPGCTQIYDYEYVRNGVADIFMVFEPLGSIRYAKVTEKRTKVDFAMCLKDISDIYYPKAQKIILVMDNLNTHTLSSLYEVFCPAEARRLFTRFEVHYTPKHGSWLNMAEIEIGVLSRQCLNSRIPNIDTMRSKVSAWENERNTAHLSVRWQFTTDDARIKLQHLYPQYLA